MTLVGAAVCPHPPLLVPEIAAGAAAELDGLRECCDAAVSRLLSLSPDLVVLVGTQRPAEPVRASLASYGVDVPIGRDPLPLASLIGRWLVDRSGWTGPLLNHVIPTTARVQRCLSDGRLLAGRSNRVAMLVMGDGSARRSERAPGYLDERATGFDATVAIALGSPDPGALTALDPDLADALLVAGRAAWQVLAGAAGDGRFAAELLYDDAPYGVGYFVAGWTLTA